MMAIVAKGMPPVKSRWTKSLQVSLNEAASNPDDILLQMPLQPATNVSLSAEAPAGLIAVP